jgi:hypothetical protein
MFNKMETKSDSQITLRWPSVENSILLEVAAMSAFAKQGYFAWKILKAGTSEAVR